MANTKNIRTNAKVFGTLEATGNTVLGGTLDVTGNADIGGNTDIGGDTVIQGDLNVLGSVSFGAGSTFNDSTFDVHDETDTSKKVMFDVTSAGPGTTTTIVASQTANRNITLPDSSTTLVGEATTQALTNKTIDADANTISNIQDANIKMGAAIARTKLALGTPEYVLVNGSGGAMAEEQYLSAARGGLAGNVSAFTGVVKAASGVFSAGALVDADVDASAAISRAKLAVGTANHVAINDGSGVLSSEAQLAASRGGLATDASAFTGLVKANGGVFTAATLVNADIDAAAAIARNKLAAGTAYRILANDASGLSSENAALTPNHVIHADANGQLVGEASLLETRGGTAQTSYAAGDTLYASASNTLSKRSIGTNGQVSKVSSAGLPSWEDALDPAREIRLYDDWISDSTGSLRWLTATNGGAGVTESTTGTPIVDASHPGVLLLSTGTTTTGRAGRSLGGVASAAGTTGYVLGGGAITQEWLVRLEDLSTAGEEFTLFAGSAETPISQAEGVYFFYQRTTSVNWQAATRAAATSTTTDTGVAVAADAWIKLRTEVNAAGTSVNFYINNVLVATHTTNITTAFIAPIIRINKSAGTAPRIFYCDYFKHYQRLTSAR